jgi:hypothetical protein
MVIVSRADVEGRLLALEGLPRGFAGFAAEVLGLEAAFAVAAPRLPEAAAAVFFGGIVGSGEGQLTRRDVVKSKCRTMQTSSNDGGLAVDATRFSEIT